MVGLHDLTDKQEVDIIKLKAEAEEAKQQMGEMAQVQGNEGRSGQVSTCLLKGHSSCDESGFRVGISCIGGALLVLPPHTTWVCTLLVSSSVDGG